MRTSVPDLAHPLEHNKAQVQSGSSREQKTKIFGYASVSPSRSHEHKTRREVQDCSFHCSPPAAGWGFSQGSASPAPRAKAMEGEEEIGLVLARASDLRSRISACAAAARPPPRLGAGEEDDGGEEEEEEVEVESLVGINDALESLERQLASLQVRFVFLAGHSVKMRFYCCSASLLLCLYLSFCATSWN